MKSRVIVLLAQLLWMPSPLLSLESRMLSFDRGGTVTFWASQTNVYGGFQYTASLGDTNSWRGVPLPFWWNFTITNHTMAMPPLPTDAMAFPSLFIRLVCSIDPLPPSFAFFFVQFANAGDFGGGFTPATTFPVSALDYRVGLDVSQDTNYPPASTVFFTGPVGSGLSGTPAARARISEDGASYSSPVVNSPVYPPSGVWMVSYKGTNQTFNVPNPPDASRLVIPFPTASVSDGVLRSVRWVYRDAASGAILSGAPPYVSMIMLQIDGVGDGRIYDSHGLPPNTTNRVLTSTVNWSNVRRMRLAYTTSPDQGEHDYVISFSRP